jgi:hypothetical protein
LFLNSIDEIPTALNIIEQFGHFSGLELNKDKTEGLLIGKTKVNNDTNIHGIKFSTKVKALWVYFGNDTDECTKFNWTEKIESCQKIINSWKQRYLTIFGRITIIKSLILPKLAFLGQTITAPDNI